MNLEKILKQLKNIEPDKKYSEKSRMLILASRKPAAPQARMVFATRNIFEVLRLTAAVGVALFVVFTFLGGTSYVNKTYSPLSYEGLDQKSLVAEADEINQSIEVTLSEINQLDRSNQKAIKTISDVSNNEPLPPAAAPESAEMSASKTLEIEQLLISSDPQNATTSNIDNLLEQLSQ